MKEDLVILALGFILGIIFRNNYKAGSTTWKFFMVAVACMAIMYSVIALYTEKIFKKIFTAKKPC